LFNIISLKIQPQTAVMVAKKTTQNKFNQASIALVAQIKANTTSHIESKNKAKFFIL
jgi:predicted XRE-type DNA-binding protein